VRPFVERDSHCPTHGSADRVEIHALQRADATRYNVRMATDSDDLPLTRREWLQASAAIGASLVSPGCASVRGVAQRRTGDLIGRPNVPYDAIIVGGGPAGLSAALALGRARNNVLLCDSGPRRNALAEARIESVSGARCAFTLHSASDVAGLPPGGRWGPGVLVVGSCRAGGGEALPHVAV
jgi:hypothetical protein